MQLNTAATFISIEPKLWIISFTTHAVWLFASFKSRTDSIEQHHVVTFLRSNDYEVRCSRLVLANNANSMLGFPTRAGTVDGLNVTSRCKENGTHHRSGRLWDKLEVNQQVDVSDSARCTRNATVYQKKMPKCHHVFESKCYSPIPG